MANSSPSAHANSDVRTASTSRLIYPWASDLGINLNELRLDDRNSEESHQRGLAQASKDHAELRKTAVEVLNHYHIQEEQRRVKLRQQQQEERLRAETALAAERARLQELEAKRIPIPPPPKPVQEPVKEKAEVPPKARGSSQPAANGVPARTTSATATNTTTSISSSAPQPLKPPPESASAQPEKPATAPASNKATSQPSPRNTHLQPTPAEVNGSSEAPNTQVKDQTNGASEATHSPAVLAVSQVTKPDRYTEIHKKLKQLRAFMQEQLKSNPQLKSKMGDMRREIRKSMGQLVEGNLASNRQPVQKITATLREALHGQVPSQPIDPNEFLLEPRASVDGLQNDSPRLPSLFIYLLNVFTKASIAQFINECGANPKAADPVGTVVAKVFSDPEFQWRGGSMIDLLLAKYRVVCPVLFGFRGNDRTEQGRLRVGWWKTQGSWIPEQIHVDRMTGLGAGFAAISLRDFSRSKNKNPYPPSNYWVALARIVNTPVTEVSDTQCYVLKAMIEHYEQKFIHFYGSAAVAALRVALVEFPAKFPKQTAAVGALPVLARILKRDSGLSLE